MKSELTKEEKRAIAALKRVAKKWPDTLWLFAASGVLCVMKTNEDGERAMLDTCGFDPDYGVDTITGISCDGGDW